MKYFKVIIKIKHIIVQGMSPDSKALLADVKSSLDREALEIDMMKLNMSAGSRLLKEKQLKLQRLEDSVVQEMVRPGKTVFN